MKTVIVIDDDKNTTDVLSEILELMNLKVIGKGYDGKDAISLYKKYHPNIVFIDLMMPKYDGFYAIEKIKEMEPSAKIIVVTSDNTKDTQKKLNKMKITSLIYKPYDYSEIRQILVDSILS